MSIRVDCPECNIKLQVSDQVAGRRVRCPACKNVFRVPAAPAATPLAPPLAMPVSPPPAAEPVGTFHAEEVDLAEVDFYSDPEAEPASDFEPEPAADFEHEHEPEPEFERELEHEHKAEAEDEIESLVDFEPDEEEEPRPARKDRNGKKKPAKSAKGESKPGFFSRLFGGGKAKKAKKSREPNEADDVSSD